MDVEPDQGANNVVRIQEIYIIFIMIFAYLISLRKVVNGIEF